MPGCGPRAAHRNQTAAREQHEQPGVHHRDEPPAAGDERRRRNPPPGTIAMSIGPNSFVTDAPTLPAPKTPSAMPCRSFGNHAAFHAMPTENEFPATPYSIAHISSSS